MGDEENFVVADHVFVEDKRTSASTERFRRRNRMDDMSTVSLLKLRSFYETSIEAEDGEHGAFCGQGPRSFRRVTCRHRSMLFRSGSGIL